jgi:pilus assembly protein Flp/PilA
MLCDTSKMSEFWSDRRGVTAIEYGLIAALMSAVLVTIFASLNTNLAAAFNAIGDSLKTAQ